MGEIKVHALRDVDIDIYEGEFVVLLGPSGSGKSTLLNILGGLDSPTSGEATWRDHNLVAANGAELTRYRREHVGTHSSACKPWCSVAYPLGNRSRGPNSLHG